MARTGKTRKQDSHITTSGKAKVEWRGYVTYELESHHKKALEARMASGVDPLDWLPRIATEGTYEVKCKWDAYNSCWVASLYCSKSGHPDAGWALPCRAADFWTALRRLAFIHIEVLSEQWGIGANDTGWTDDKW